MATLYYANQYVVTKLAVGGGIDASQTTGIILQSVAGVDITKPGIVCLSWSDPLDTTLYEYASYTSINGSNELQGVTRGVDGSTGRSHLNLSDIAFVVSESHINNVNDRLTSRDAILASDPNENEIIKTAYVSSAVNEITITNSATGNPPILSATGGDTNISLLINTKGTGIFVAPLALAEGQMLNGKIDVTVASNNLTVALKTMAGTDATASNPIHIRIGNAIRTVTSALSVTKNAGTNWCNAGSAELATKEIDYFVYLFYASTAQEVRVAFGRIPYANTIQAFNGYTTSETAIMEASGSGFSVTDSVVNIGRFAATLSAGAEYTWTVPTFTATNLIQRPIYETRTLRASPVKSGTDSMTVALSGSDELCRYQISGNKMSVYYGAIFVLGGTASYGVNVTLPMAASLNGSTGLNASLGLSAGTVEHTNGTGGQWFMQYGSPTTSIIRSEAGNYTLGTYHFRGHLSYLIS